MLIKAGEYIILSEGEYSDKRVGPLTRARREFDTVEIEKEWLAANANLDEDSMSFMQTPLALFREWLTRENVQACEYGPLEIVDSRPYWIGAYGRVAHTDTPDGSDGQ